MQDVIIEALRRGAHDEALEAASEWVSRDPGNAQAHRWLAVSQAQAGVHAAALSSIDRAIELSPDEAELHLVRGSILLGTRRPDDAQAALAQATGLDPNQLGAYFLQAQMAVARGDADEAERLAKLAARLAPGHPQLTAIEGMVALRRGDADGAVRLLADTAARTPGEPQLFYALGFAYLAKDHLAFAEQAFSRVLELLPAAHALRGLIADLMLRQGRPEEALDQLRPLLERDSAGFAAQRLGGILEMAAGRPERAVPWLRAALGAQPRDPQVASALVDAWSRLGVPGPAQEALDELLDAHPEVAQLWEARLAFTDPGEARAVVERWLQAMPDHPAALEALATVQDLEGDSEGAIGTTRRVVELAPGRLASELRLASLEQRVDPAAAVARLERLAAEQQDPAVRRQLAATLGLVLDRAGRHDAAARAWLGLHADALPRAFPRPAVVAAPDAWPPLGAPSAGDAPAIAFLWGAPGSGVDQLGTQARRAELPVLGDRFSERPPADPLQRPDTGAQLAGGSLAAEAVVAQWREALPRRGVADGPLIDWLPWWDNALLLALRPHLPAALLLVALRDPRDMLLDWIAFGRPLPLAIESPVAAAGWLSGVLDQVAALHEQDLYPHRLVRLDDAMDDGAALTDALNIALDLDLPSPPPLPPPTVQRLPAGRWRDYRGVLGEAFDLLSDVAQRLGYPAA